MTQAEKYHTFSDEDFEAQALLKKSRTRLLSFQEIPAWQKDNEFIFHGYRPEFKNARACFESLHYMHNETISIYTHLIPGILRFWNSFPLWKALGTEVGGLDVLHYPYFVTHTIAYGRRSQSGQPKWENILPIRPKYRYRPKGYRPEGVSGIRPNNISSG